MNVLELQMLYTTDVNVKWYMQFRKQIDNLLKC